VWLGEEQYIAGFQRVRMHELETCYIAEVGMQRVDVAPHCRTAGDLRDLDVWMEK
jgi:hypothetical protein